MKTYHGIGIARILPTYFHHGMRGRKVDGGDEYLTHTCFFSTCNHLGKIIFELFTIQVSMGVYEGYRFQVSNFKIKVLIIMRFMTTIIIDDAKLTALLETHLRRLILKMLLYLIPKVKQNLIHFRT